MNQQEPVQLPQEHPDLSVVGLGKLGLCLAVTLAGSGFKVHGVDNDDGRVAAIRSGTIRTSERGLNAGLTRNRERLIVGSDIQAAVAATAATFVVVPTPTDGNGGFSLQSINPVLDEIGRALTHLHRYHLVVITSTIMPGATDNEIIPTLERVSGKSCGKDFGLCYSPEFIALGDVLDGLSHPDFVLIGQSDLRSGKMLQEIQRRVVGPSVPILTMPPTSAEITKLAVNAFVTLKISFANSVAEICEKYPKANVDTITSAIGTDARIGRMYLRGSLGFGGPCFPRDTIAFSRAANVCGSQSFLTDAAHRVNETQVPRALALIESHGFKPPQKVAILGLTYKPGTDVTEASQSVMLANSLVTKGFRVTAFDPAVSPNRHQEFDPRIALTSSVKDCLDGARLCIVATAWDDFKGLRLADFGATWIFDCWRIYAGSEIERSGRYFSIGVGLPTGSIAKEPDLAVPRPESRSRRRSTARRANSTE